MARDVNKSGLQKTIRKANDRLRALEGKGNTSSQAYREAQRQIKNIRERAPRGAAPAARFQTQGQTKEQLKQTEKAAKKFLESQESTNQGINRRIKNVAKTISQRSGRSVSKEEAKAIGDAWEAVRGGGKYKYDPTYDSATNDIITKAVAEGRDPSEIADFIDEMREEGVPPDEWEELFDESFGDEDELDEDDFDEDDYLFFGDDDEDNEPEPPKPAAKPKKPKKPK